MGNFVKVAFIPCTAIEGKSAKTRALHFRELTCAALSKDFGLEVDLPDDRLVPMVPQRLNYIHWVEDLLAGDTGEWPQGGRVCGIDIG